MKAVTAWYRQVKINGAVTFDFNHIEDGAAEGDKPTPQHPNHQHCWAGVWKKEICGLTSDLPPKVVRNVEVDNQF